MLQGGFILTVSFGYLGLLFAIAYFGDKRADAGRSIIANPYIYALSLTVYCTAWTFYGSVGRAANSGVGFLPIYIGPTVLAPLWWIVLRKIVRISKIHRITSIADFIASRYGKSTLLGGLATVIAVLGIVPYISLQLKAISTSFLVISEYPEIRMPTDPGQLSIFHDTAFYAALVLAAFTILFGTRHLDATERHEGLVAAIAFESVVKLAAFLAVGIFVTYGLYNGFSDILTKAETVPNLMELFHFGDAHGTYGNWTWLVFLSMLAVILLPRQFQVAVVENVNEDHIRKAIWLFPLYLWAINLFVLPVTIAGLVHFAGGPVEADSFVLALPMAEKKEWLALFVFLGGMSAATGMVIVATIALSTMVCNDLVMPVLLRVPEPNLLQRKELGGLLLGIRRGVIILVLLLSYVYFRYVGEFYTLVSIGLVSFTAVAQFAPALLGGIFWKGGTRWGALCGLSGGFLIWAYTLVLPSLSHAGLLPVTLLDEGPFGISILRPDHLFGLQHFDPVSHAMFWSMLINVSLYVGGSLLSRPSVIELNQANLFVDVFRPPGMLAESTIWKGRALVPDLKSLLARFLGAKRSDEIFAAYAKQHNVDWSLSWEADPGLVDYAEKILAGAIGSASARAMVASVVKEEPVSLEEVMHIVDEARQIKAYSRELERKSRQLEQATAELRAANARLQELDQLKDEFISTITHELRTPLTSIRAFAEILIDNPDMDVAQRKEFLDIVTRESERLSRLINEVLDFQKVESGAVALDFTQVDIREVIQEVFASLGRIIEEKGIEVEFEIPVQVPKIEGDHDRLTQVVMNLVSNAVKFCDPERGFIGITVKVQKNSLRVDVRDNGVGISPAMQNIIFEKFRQVEDAVRGRPAGSGLGLAITKRIVEIHGGRIWVDSVPSKGSVFSFVLPLKAEQRLQKLRSESLTD